MPDWRKSWSTSVVLPWSTCAIMAILRILSIGKSLPGRRAGNLTRDGSLVKLRQPLEPSAGVLAAITTNRFLLELVRLPGVYTASYVLIQVVGFFLGGIVAGMVLRTRSATVLKLSLVTTAVIGMKFTHCQCWPAIHRGINSFCLAVAAYETPGRASVVLASMCRARNLPSGTS